MPLRRSGQVCRGLVSLVVPLMVLMGVCLVTSVTAASAQTPVPINSSYPGRYFADVDSSSANIDDILIFNPHTVAVTARITFTKADGSGVVRDMVVNALTRTQLKVQEEPNVGGGGGVSVAVQSLDVERPLYAEHSQYVSERRGGRNTEGALPASSWYFAEGLADSSYAETITVYSLSAETVTLTCVFVGEDGSITSTTVRSADRGGPIGVLLRSSGNQQSRERLGRASTPTAAADTVWYFAEASTKRATGPLADSSLPYFSWALLGLANPGTTSAAVTITLHDTAGSTHSITASLPATTQVYIPVGTLFAGLPLGHYAIVVTSTVPIVAERRRPSR